MNIKTRLTKLEAAIDPNSALFCGIYLPPCWINGIGSIEWATLPKAKSNAKCIMY